MSAPAPLEGTRTQVIELLQAYHVAYRLLPHSEPVFTVAAAAEKRGVILEEMVKSILLRESGGNRYVMACVRGPDRLDTQALRGLLDGPWRRLTFASREQILEVTGYVQGAVAPLCVPASIPVVFDEAISGCARVNISSGDPMLGLELETQDLIRLAQARLARIASPGDRSPLDL